MALVVVDEVAPFVSHHRVELSVRKRLDESIADHHLSGRAGDRVGQGLAGRKTDDIDAVDGVCECG